MRVHCVDCEQQSQLQELDDHHGDVMSECHPSDYGVRVSTVERSQGVKSPSRKGCRHIMKFSFSLCVFLYLG